MFKYSFRTISVFIICTIFIWGCSADGGNTFFDPTIKSDLVQNGTFILTNDGLRERERAYASQTFLSCGSRFEQPDFKSNLIVVIEANNLSIDNIIFPFVRTENYYKAEYNEVFLYFSFKGDVINMLLTNFENYNQLNLQFIRSA